MRMRSHSADRQVAALRNLAIVLVTIIASALLAYRWHAGASVSADWSSRRDGIQPLERKAAAAKGIWSSRHSDLDSRRENSQQSKSGSVMRHGGQSGGGSGSGSSSNKGSVQTTSSRKSSEGDGPAMSVDKAQTQQAPAAAAESDNGAATATGSEPAAAAHAVAKAASPAAADEPWLLPQARSRHPVATGHKLPKRCRLRQNLPLDWRGNVLQAENGSGKFNTSQGCWQRCRDAGAACAAWYWCGQEGGCTDADGIHVPFQGCELRKLEVLRSVGRYQPGWQPPTFATGFSRAIHTRKEAEPFTLNEHKQWVADGYARNSSGSGLLVFTSVHPKPCQKPFGDVMNRLSVLNKLDYARLHGYEFHLFVSLVDPSLPKMYAKVALLQKLLQEVPRERAEWLFWIDADTVFQALTFQVPLRQYGGKNLVLWGDAERIQAGDQIGVNTGSMLVRSGRRAAQFWDEVARVSRIHQADSHEPGSREAEIEAELRWQVVVSGAVDDTRDQNAVVYLLRKQPEAMNQTFLERGRYCINCWWQDVPKSQKRPAFVNHFAGCQMCTHPTPRLEAAAALGIAGENSNCTTFFDERDAAGGNGGSGERLHPCEREAAAAKAKASAVLQQLDQACMDSFLANFDFANRTMAWFLGCERRRPEWGPPLGRFLNSTS